MCVCVCVCVCVSPHSFVDSLFRLVPQTSHQFAGLIPLLEYVCAQIVCMRGTGEFRAVAAGHSVRKNALDTLVLYAALNEACDCTYKPPDIVTSSRHHCTPKPSPALAGWC